MDSPPPLFYSISTSAQEFQTCGLTKSRHISSIVSSSVSVSRVAR